MREVLFGSYLRWLQEPTAFKERAQKYFSAMWEVLDGPVLKDVIEQTGNDVQSIKMQNAVRGKVRKEYVKIRERSCGPDE